MRLTQLLSVTCLLILLLQPIHAQEKSEELPTTTRPTDTRPDDSRLQPLKDLNGFFPLEVPGSKRAWEERADDLRRRVLVATGLWPLPQRTPLNAVIHGKVTRPETRVKRDGATITRIGFTVERVYFESVPNHFVTGLLFRPDDGKKGVKRPAVLCPHGHGGRLQKHNPEKMAQLIEDGEELYPESGQYPKLARCAHLARMGCVVFIYDMLGYADSQQISRELAHGFSRQRPDFEGKSDWGLFSTQAELRLQSVFGVQTWNSIRCLDFLEQLPDVDGSRMAVTGGSGGGTQTIILCAIDQRPIAAFPNGMVSSAMQGGCTCENCTLLRVGTGNVELSALFAPKPQGMTAADDWTREMLIEGKGFPELQRVYALFGAEENVLCEDLTRFPHNYNYVSRALMYKWFNKHMELGLEDPYEELDYSLLTPEEMQVWNEEHPQPVGGDQYERELTKYLAEVSDKQIGALQPKDEASLKEYQQVVGGAIRTLIGRDLPAESDINTEKFAEDKHDEYLSFEHRVHLKTKGEVVPITTLWPTKTKWNGDVVVWLNDQGKRGLYADDKPHAQVQELLKRGAAVLSPDLFMQGDYLLEEESDDPQRVVNNPREAAAYSFCYNHTLFAQRVHDVLTLISYIRGYKAEGETPKRLHLIGVDGMGPIAVAAGAIGGEQVDKVVAHTNGFRFADITSYRQAGFLPGIVKYGDLPALISLNASHDVCIVGESTADMSQARSNFALRERAFVSRDERGSVDWVIR